MNGPLNHCFNRLIRSKINLEMKHRCVLLGNTQHVLRWFYVKKSII